MVPAKARVVHHAARNRASPIADRAPDRRRSQTISEKKLGIAARIGLHRPSKAARNRILVRDSIVDLYVALIAIELLRDFLKSVVRKVVVNGLRIERRGKQRRSHRTDHA